MGLQCSVQLWSSGSFNLEVLCGPSMVCIEVIMSLSGSISPVLRSQMGLVGGGQLICIKMLWCMGAVRLWHIVETPWVSGIQRSDGWSTARPLHHPTELTVTTAKPRPLPRSFLSYLSPPPPTHHPPVSITLCFSSRRFCLSSVRIYSYSHNTSTLIQTNVCCISIIWANNNHLFNLI